VIRLAEKKKTEEIRFTKEQIVNSQKYKDKNDLVNALLKDGQLYSIKEVDELIEKFLKGKVR